MKKAIICEGKTDAIILGLFLEAYGWQFLSKGKRPFNFLIDEKNQTVEWFFHPDRPGEELLIWGAGGITRIEATLFKVLDRTKSDPNLRTRFSKLVLVFDADARTVAESTELVVQWVVNAGIKTTGLGLGVWNAHSMPLNGTGNQNHEFELLPIAIPLNEPGDLEMFLRNAVGNMSAADQRLVLQGNSFIDNQPDDPYLAQRRFRSKAALGVILSVISPDWVFGDLIQKLRQVSWHELETVQTAFSLLSGI